MTADAGAVGATTGPRGESDTLITQGGERPGSGTDLGRLLVTDQW